ncbi:putative bifunctional diguanylate cyclase/phosphodiesterase [Consotaella aegiceratis]|uniref:putative bifunctional diguanylate cyclase/phosphodiesterase n=1 Tax=Consotaella aegiceratis TaxID=3097961 RepID=UPI002F3F25C0
MAISKLRRYGSPVAVGAAVTAFVVISTLMLGTNTVGHLIDSAMREKGAAFAELLISEEGNVDAFLTGIARKADAEATVRDVAALSDIGSFVIFDRYGKEVFRSRSDRYAWLLRDRPGGVSTGDRLSDTVLARKGSWQVVYDDGRSNPSVLMPLIRNGQTIGYVSVDANMNDDRQTYGSTLMGSSLTLLCIVLLATGLPMLLYVRRRRKMQEADDRIYFLANHDPLTHLLNRTRMQEETDRVLGTARATRERMAYYFIDIDGLADINDSLGQASGDQLLRIVASRLSSIVESSDLLARVGPDDFALLHRRISDSGELDRLSSRIVDAVGEPVELMGQVIRPRISIGVAQAPLDGKTHDELFKYSHLALAYHKAERNGDFALFESFMDEETHKRREIEAMVRNAVETDGFCLFYQPIVSSDGSRLLGFEALVRMPDGNGGYVPPSEFVPVAEARGYIKAIGTWVLREATRQIAQWPDDLFVSVNLSAVQFRDGDLLDIVRQALAEAGISGRRLEIEVVESLLLQRSDDILAQLNDLKALGVSIDMDDFGTGYSSLGYLWRFPFDKLKIDQSFMFAYEHGEPNVSEIIATIVALAHQMRMKVTAEGVETQAQVDLLHSFGCDQLQGYFFAKPAPPDRIAAEVLTRFKQRMGYGPADGRDDSQPRRQSVG